MNKKLTKLRETSGYDELKTQAIDRFRSQDPMTLSDSELRSAIDYMLAYRWALEGDEDVLHEYIEASKIRSNIGNNYKNESRYMNKKLIRLTESDLHKIVKESVHKIINEIGDTEKGQDALGQVYGRAIRRAQNLGDKGAVPRKLRNVARDAKDKAYSQAPNHDIYADSPFDKGISTGYEKAEKKSSVRRAVKESINRVLKEGHNEDYMEAKQIIDGMDFEDVKKLPYMDDRFSFGALNGSEGEGLIDLNFKGILVTVRSVAKVTNNFEKYDEGGQFLGVEG